MTTSARSAAGQLAHPPVAGGAHRVVDPECRCEACAVDGIDPGDAPGAGRLGDVGEQQPDRALADDRDVHGRPDPAIARRHTGHTPAVAGRRLRRGQRRIVRRQPVAVADHAFHQAVEPGGPAHHAIARTVLGVPAGDHLAGDFVDREPVLLGGAYAVVAREPSPGAAKGRHVAAADAGGQKPQQHLTIGQVVGRLVSDRRALEQIRGDDPVGPHVRPPPGSCSIPTGSWTAAGWRRHLGSR